MKYRNPVHAIKLLVLLCLCPVLLSACNSADANVPATEAIPSANDPVPPRDDPPSPETKIGTAKGDYYMSYKVNGKRFLVNYGQTLSVKNDVRYTVGGISKIQGDLNGVIIDHNDGPPRVGSFSTGERNLMLSVTLFDEGLWTTRSTLDFSNLNYGDGIFSITEVTDKYIKGTFDFVATWAGGDVPNKRFDVTDGHFKVKMTAPH